MYYNTYAYVYHESRLNRPESVSLPLLARQVILVQVYLGLKKEQKQWACFRVLLAYVAATYNSLNAD